MEEVRQKQTKRGAYTVLVYLYKILGNANKSIVTGSVISWRCGGVRAEWSRTEGLPWGTKHARSDGYANYFDCGEGFTGVYICPSLCNSIC